MKVLTTAIEGVVILEPEVFGDARGYFFESYSQRRFDAQVRPVRFVQDNDELTFSSLSLYYEFNPRLISKIRLKRLKLAFYMNNIATLSSIRIERGTTYPFARSMSFQLTGTF